jgi:hypothetical protein
LYHVHIREIPEPEEGEEPAKKEEGQDDDDELDYPLDVNKVYMRKVVPNISKLWLSVKPSAEVFFVDIMRCITEGLNCI